MSRLSRKMRRAAGSAIKIAKEERNVAILTPCNDTVHTEFMASLVSLMQHTICSQPENLRGFAFQSYGTSMLPWSRQMLATWALEQGATHLLFIDSDMQFPRDMVLRWLQRDEKIIGINAASRRPPHRNTAQTGPGTELETNIDSVGLEKVYRTGFGIAWIAAEVFRSIDLPWFEFQWVPEKSVFRGEDYAFLDKAKAAGYEVYVDHDVSKQVNHIGTFGYNPVLKTLAAQARMGEEA